MCGLAGALIANHTDFVSPAMMYWTRSGDLIIMVVLGGMGSVIGPVFGAVALLVLEEALSGITEYWQIILGPLLLLVVLFARGGIDGLLKLADPKVRAMSEPLLQVEHLAKRFGGIVATDDLSLGIAAGELHAVIGPNGAGKTTLIAQLSGQIQPGLRPHPTLPAATSPRCRCTGAASSGWRARSRSPRCSSISPCSTMWRWRCRPMPATRSASGATRAASPSCASRRARRLRASASRRAPSDGPRR